MWAKSSLFKTCSLLNEIILILWFVFYVLSNTLFCDQMAGYHTLWTNISTRCFSMLRRTSAEGKFLVSHGEAEWSGSPVQHGEDFHAGLSGWPITESGPLCPDCPHEHLPCGNDSLWLWERESDHRHRSQGKRLRLHLPLIKTRCSEHVKHTSEFIDKPFAIWSK